MTAPVEIDIPPGVLKTVSVLAAKGRWIDADKVRFVNAKPEKWGGWSKYVATPLDGNCRGAMAWISAAKESLIATGTWRKLYNLTGDSTIDPQDITPFTSTGTLGNNPFTTTLSSNVVTVAHTAHGRAVNSYVLYSGATAVGGLTLNGTFLVLTVTDANTYTIDAGSNASSGANGGGAAVAFSYYLNPGQMDTIYGTGWGAGTWGTGTWGTPRANSSLTIEMRYWSLHRYGSELLACPGDDTIYLWDQAGGAARAVALTNAPAVVRYAFVTNERFIFALGTSTAMTIQWPDVSDPTNWTPALANTANSRVLQAGNKLMAGCTFQDAINILWSDSAIFVAQYLPGNDLIYDIAPVRLEAGLLGQGAFCVTPIGVFWLSANDVLLYNGSVSEAPSFNDIRDWFFRRFRRDKAHKAVMVYNALKNEVQLHFASITGNGENNEYIACALDTMSWVPGTMDGAGAWGHTAIAAFDDPTSRIFAAHADTYVYEHEIGTDADGTAMAAYIESGVVASADGLTDQDVVGYEPNFERQTGNITLDVEAYDRPRGEQLATPIDSGSFTISPTDSLIDFLIGGRYLKHRLTSNVVGGDFRLGLGIFETGPAGDSR